VGGVQWRKHARLYFAAGGPVFVLPLADLGNTFEITLSELGGYCPARSSYAPIDAKRDSAETRQRVLAVQLIRCGTRIDFVIPREASACHIGGNSIRYLSKASPGIRSTLPMVVAATRRDLIPCVQQNAQRQYEPLAGRCRRSQARRFHIVICSRLAPSFPSLHGRSFTLLPFANAFIESSRCYRRFVHPLRSPLPFDSAALALIGDIQNSLRVPSGSISKTPQCQRHGIPCTFG